VQWKTKTASVLKEWNIQLKTLDLNAQQTPSWPNVRVWLERLYKGEVTIRYPASDQEVVKGDMMTKVQRLTLELAFKTVLCSRASGEEWDEQKVETAHQILMKTNFLWT
jgi:hypothetical protein